VEHTHQNDGPNACMITKEQAADLADVTTRTVELWANQGVITKFTVGPTGYWVRFCREEIRGKMDPVAVLIDQALERVTTGTAGASGSG